MNLLATFSDFLRVFSRVRARYAHISRFPFFAFTPSPTCRNLLILIRLGVKTFIPEPSPSAPSPVSLSGVIDLRSNRRVKER